MGGDSTGGECGGGSRRAGRAADRGGRATCAAAPRRQARPPVRGGVRPCTRCAGPSLGGRDALALHRRRTHQGGRRAPRHRLVHLGPPTPAALRRRDGTGLPSRRVADRGRGGGPGASREPADTVRRRPRTAAGGRRSGARAAGPDRGGPTGHLRPAHGGRARGVRPGRSPVHRWADLREPCLDIDVPDWPVPSSWWLRPRDARLSLRGKDGHGDPHRTEVPAWEVVNWCALVTLWKRLRAR